jgi:hypothetical protein
MSQIDTQLLQDNIKYWEDCYINNKIEWHINDGKKKVYNFVIYIYIVVEDKDAFCDKSQTCLFQNVTSCC